MISNPRGYLLIGNNVVPLSADSWPYRCTVCERFYAQPGKCLFPFCDGELLHYADREEFAS